MAVTLGSQCHNLKALGIKTWGFFVPENYFKINCKSACVARNGGLYLLHTNANRGTKMKSLKAKLEAARNAAEKFEFGTEEWESAMVKVRALVDEINAKFPPAPWSDREWSDMMSR